VESKNTLDKSLKVQYKLTLYQYRIINNIVNNIIKKIFLLIFLVEEIEINK